MLCSVIVALPESLIYLFAVIDADANTGLCFITLNYIHRLMIVAQNLV